MTYPNFDDHCANWTESETKLIGCLLLEPELIREVCEIVSHNDFFDRSLGSFFGLLCAMRDAGEPIRNNALLVANIKQLGIWSGLGEAAGLAKLACSVECHSDIFFHADAVSGWSSIREVRKCLLDSLRLTEVHTPLNCLDEIADRLQTVVAHRRAPQGVEIITARQAMQVARDIAAAALKSGNPTGVPSGFESIDSHCGGFMRGELTTLAASTGFGKSAFALETVARIAEAGLQPLMLSFEMQDLQIGQRYLARLTGVPVSIMRTGCDLRESDIPRFDIAIKTEAVDRIDLVAGTALDIRQVCNVVRKYMTKKRLDLLVVDYIGKVKRPYGQSLTDLASEVTGTLKELALELSIPILSLAQLNRQAEQQQQPGLSNLADSASIERDSDAVWLLYGKRGETNLILEIAKNRQGRTGVIPLNFQSAKMLWTEAGGI